MIKRFASNELGESASRRPGHDWETDYAKSSRAMCRVCKKNIEKGEVRIALMLQDDEGYKSANWTHLACFWKHKETKKLEGTHEIKGFSKLKKEDKAKIEEMLEQFKSNPKNKTPTKGKRKKGSDDEDDYKPKKKKQTRKKSEDSD